MFGKRKQTEIEDLKNQIGVLTSKINDLNDKNVVLTAKVANLELSYQQLQEAYIKREELEREHNPVNLQPKHGYRFDEGMRYE